MQNLDHESPAVQKHLEIMQGVIQRMAENSRYCKLWCVTLVSAVLVLVARAEKPEYALVALVPAAMLTVMDAYYLALERGYRRSYSEFVDKLHEGTWVPADLYKVRRTGSDIRLFLKCLISFSIWPFYPLLFGMILLVWWIVKL